MPTALHSHAWLRSPSLHVVYRARQPSRPALPTHPDKTVMNVQVESAILDQLGTARKVIIRATETTLIADAANKEEIDMRVKQVRRCPS